MFVAFVSCEISASSSETDTGVLCEQLRVASGHRAGEDSSTEGPSKGGRKNSPLTAADLSFESFQWFEELIQIHPALYSTVE